MKSSSITPAMSKRDGYYDCLKFVLITLVILGHTLEANLESRISLALYNTIYLFHMPLFIFVTGYFTKKQIDTKKQIRSLLMILETLVVFQTFHYMRNGATGGNFSCLHS